VLLWLLVSSGIVGIGSQQAVSQAMVDELAGSATIAFKFN
jgi:hypothetical protein